MFYGILILAIILLIAAWVYEKSENIILLREVERYNNELAEERKWGKRMCLERNDAIKRYIEFEKAQCDSALKGYEAPVAEVIGSITV